MGYLSVKWGLIDRIGAHIWTFNDDRVTYITSLQTLKKWLHADKSRMLFIFDEGLKQGYRRTVVSKKNIGTHACKCCVAKD